MRRVYAWPPKPRVKVFIHNGTTVYESANNIAEWEVKYAQYIDSINTDMVLKGCPLSVEMKWLSDLTGVTVTRISRSHARIEVEFEHKGRKRFIRTYRSLIDNSLHISRTIESLKEYAA